MTVTEADVRKLLTEEENRALDLAFESEKERGIKETRWPDESAAHWLSAAFNWRESPQGSRYWGSVCARLDTPQNSPEPTPLPDMMTAEYCLSALITGRATATEQQAAARHMREMMEVPNELMLSAEAVLKCWYDDADIVDLAKNMDHLEAIVRQMRMQANEQAGHPAQLVNEDGV